MCQFFFESTDIFSVNDNKKKQKQASKQANKQTNNQKNATNRWQKPLSHEDFASLLGAVLVPPATEFVQPNSKLKYPL